MPADEFATIREALDYMKGAAFETVIPRELAENGLAALDSLEERVRALTTAVESAEFEIGEVLLDLKRVSP